MESKKIKLIETDSWNEGCQGPGGGGNEEILVKEYKVAVMQDE